LKIGLAAKAVKTVNNVLTVLSVLLKKAVEWKVIGYMPCTITLLRVSRGSTRFYDFDEFERLVDAARSTDARCSSTGFVGGRGGPATGRDGGARMDRHRLRQASGLRAAVGVEGTDRVAERWAAAVHPAHDATRESASRSPSSPRSTRVVPKRWVVAD